MVRDSERMNSEPAVLVVTAAVVAVAEELFRIIPGVLDRDLVSLT